MARKKGQILNDPFLDQLFKQAMGAGDSTPRPSGKPVKRVSGIKKAGAGGSSVGTKPVPPTDAGVRSKLAEIKTHELQNKVSGIKVDNPNKQGGFWHRLLDIISRGNYAVAEASNRGIAERGYGGKDFKGGGIGDTLAETARGFWGGLSGKNKTTFSDVIQNTADAYHAGKAGKRPQQIKRGEGHVNTAVKVGVGLTADIFLDPTTYLGIGLGSKAGRVGKLGKQIKDMEKTLDKVGIVGGKEREILTGAKVVSGEQSVKAAKAAKMDVDKAAELGGRFHATNVKKARLAEGVPLKVATQDAKIAGEEMRLQLGKMADSIIKDAGPRNLTIKGVGPFLSKTGGADQIGLEIPLSRYAVAAAQAPFNLIAKWDPAKNAATKFADAFNNSARVFPEMQQLRQEHRGSGLARTHIRGQYLRDVFKPLGKENRVKIFDNVVNGAPSGVMIKDHTGKEIDATDWSLDRINRVYQQFLGPGIDDSVRLEGRDLQRFSHYSGITFKKQNGQLEVGDILEALKNGKVKDIGQAHFIIESAAEQALARRSMLNAFKETWGAKTGTVHDVITKHGEQTVAANPELLPYKHAKDLAASGWKEINHVPELKGYIFDPDTAAGMERILDVLEDERKMGAMLQGINKLTGKWKFFVTVPNPGFHIRNSIGDLYVNMMDQVGDGAYGKALKLLHNKKGFETFAEGSTPLMQVENQVLMQQAARHPHGNQQFLKVKGGFTDLNGTRRDTLNMGEMWAAYNKYGMRQNYTLSEYGEAFDEAALLGGAIRNAKEKLTTASENREDYFRLAHFIHMVQQNPKKLKNLNDIMSYAASRVRKTHFDYTDFTKFERMGMANIMPFYKWTRKSLPLQTELFFSRPGRVAVIPKLQRAMSEMTGYDWEDYNYLNTQEVIPQYIRDGGFLPISTPDSIDKDSQAYFNIGSPFGDAAGSYGNLLGGDIGTSKKAALSSLNPAVKAAFEWYGNKSAFTGAPVYEEGAGKKQHLKDLARYAAGLTPISRNIGNYVQGKDTANASLAAWVSGLGLQVNTPSRQTGELIRRDIENNKRYQKWRKQYLKKYNLPPDTRLR